MSQLLHKKFDVVNRTNTIHRDRIYSDRKTVNKIVKEINGILKVIEEKPYYKYRRITKHKLRKAINFEVKNAMDDLIYIINHNRVKFKTVKYAKKMKTQLDEKIESMIEQGMEF